MTRWAFLGLPVTALVAASAVVVLGQVVPATEQQCPVANDTPSAPSTAVSTPAAVSSSPTGLPVDRLQEMLSHAFSMLNGVPPGPTGTPVASSAPPTTPSPSIPAQCPPAGWLTGATR